MTAFVLCLHYVFVGSEMSTVTTEDGGQHPANGILPRMGPSITPPTLIAPDCEAQAQHTTTSGIKVWLTSSREKKCKISVFFSKPKGSLYMLQNEPHMVLYTISV